MFGFRRQADSAPELRCSFCNKSQRFVKRLIAGPNVYICDECVDVCLGILNDGPEEVAAPLVAATHACSLCNIPVAATESLPIGARGLLCPGCVSEIEAAFQERRPSPPQGS